MKCPRFFFAFGMLAAVSILTSSQERREGAPTPIGLEKKPTPELQAMLWFQNRDITMLRATVGGFPPKQRAENIAARIQRVLAPKKVAPAVTRRNIPQGVAFYFDEQLALAIFSDDLDTAAGQSMDDAADDAEQRLALAVNEYFELHDTSRMLNSTLQALGATVLFVVFVVLMQGVRRLLWRLWESRHSSAQDPSGATPLFSRWTGSALRSFLGVAVLFVELAAANIWLTFVLRRFPYTRPWGESLVSKLLHTLEQCELAVIRSLPSLVIVFVIAAGCYGATRLANKLFLAIKTGDIQIAGIHPQSAAPTRRLVVAAIWIFGLIVAYPYIPGSRTDAFKGVSIFVGLLVTLGSSGVFGQLISGVLLMYSRAYKPGDYVRIAGTEGTVIELAALATKIRTIKNEVVNVPNTLAVNTQTKNFSGLHASVGVIVHTSVTIGYTAPWRQVEAMLLIAARRTPGILSEPEAFVLQTALGDYAVRYQINGFLASPEDRIPTLARLHRNIQDIFNHYNVQIMTPHYRTDPGEPHVVPKDLWFTPPAEHASTADASKEVLPFPADSARSA